MLETNNNIGVFLVDQTIISFSTFLSPIQPSQLDFCVGDIFTNTTPILVSKSVLIQTVLK